jgi:hypothetical protein
MTVCVFAGGVICGLGAAILLLYVMQAVWASVHKDNE